jgi:hypothetical protein
MKNSSKKASFPPEFLRACTQFNGFKSKYGPFCVSVAQKTTHGGGSNKLE